MYFFATITSKKHIVQTLILINQLKKENIFLLCTDTESYNFFKGKFFNSKLIIFNKNYICRLKNKYNILSNKKTNIAFSIKPFFLFSILKKIPKSNHVIYLDADIFFFSSVKILKKMITNYPMCLSKHSFSLGNKENIKYGIFNAGFVSFQSSNLGFQYLRLWKERCKNLAELDTKKKQWGDQYCLNVFQKYGRVLKISNPGVNAAPWNLENNFFNQKKKYFYLGKNKIIFFHFQGLKIINKYFVNTGLSNYSCSNKKDFLILYKIYLAKIKMIIKNYDLKFLNIKFFDIIQIGKYLLKKDLIY